MSFRILVLASLSCLFVESALATPAIHWKRTDSYYTTQAGQAAGRRIDSDAAGNVYIAGTVNGTYDFGGGPLAGPDASLFVAKYSPSGEYLWSKRFRPTYPFEGLGGLSAEAAGGVYVTGMFRGSVNFGGSTLTSSNGSTNTIFVVRFDTDGNHVWSAKFSNGGSAYAPSIGVDGQGNCYLAGRFFGTVNFGGANLVCAGEFDMFLASFSAIGQHRWSQRFGTVDYDDVTAVTVDKDANVAIVGYLHDPTSFGGPVLPATANAESPFVAKFNTDGLHLWSHSYLSTGWAEVDVVDFDMDGNVLFAGLNQAGPIDFGGGPLTYGMYLVKLSASGAHQWSKRFAGAVSISTWPRSLSVDAANHIVMIGHGPANGIDLGGGAMNNDLFVGRFLPDGSLYWSTALTGATYHSPDQYGAADADGNVLLTGFYSGNYDAGILANPNLDETLVVKLAADPAEPLITAVADVPGDQGGQLRLTFRHSGHDAETATTPIVEYQAYRQLAVPGTWEFVGSIPADDEEIYQMVVPTLTNAGVSTFLISATTSAPGTFFNSNVAGGQSIDNLAPDTPSNIVYQSGTLMWDGASAADLDFYTVYGSGTDSYGSAILVDHSAVPLLDVTGSPYLFYFVTATDNSGNESAPGSVNTLTGVGGTTNRYVLSVSCYPNPFNPRTTVSYTVPSRGPVTISIYDTNGARVAMLFKGERNAGAYSVNWDGRTEDAAFAASGVYFARIEHANGTRTKKMVLLK